MKAVLSLPVLFLLSANVFAQSFTVTASYISFSGSATQNDIASPLYLPVINNNSGDTLTLRWKRVEQNIPGWWRSSVCTEYYCYSIPDDSATWVLLPGDSDLMYIHIYPYGYADTGNVVVKLFNVNNPADSVRIMFHADIATGIAEQGALSSFSCDPVSHAVSFSDERSGTWSLCDISGRVLQKGDYFNGNTQNISAGRAGIFIFIFRREDGTEAICKVLL